MRRTFLILIALLLAAPAFAQDFAYCKKKVAAGGDTACGTGDKGNTNTTGNASYNNATDNEIIAVRISVGCSGTIDNVAFFGHYFDGSSQEGGMALYYDNGSNLMPGALLADVGKSYNGAASPNWVSVGGLSVSVTGDPTYLWVAVKAESANSVWRHVSTTGQVAVTKVVAPFSSWESTWDPTGTTALPTTSMFLHKVHFQ